MIDWRWVYPTEMPANERRVIRAHSVWVPAGRVSTRTRVHHRGSCQQGVFYLEKKTLKKLNACVCACVCRRQQIERTDVKGMRESVVVNAQLCLSLPGWEEDGAKPRALAYVPRPSVVLVSGGGAGGDVRP